MIKEIMHEEGFLSQKSEIATKDDLYIADDLRDTLKAHKDGCVGMAANMIGINKRIIIFESDDEYVVMFNPEIIKKQDSFETEEACLSLQGYSKKTKRYKSVKVRWQNEKFEWRIKTFTGWTAQIIQHEIDHCNGILI
ncbi:MAG: peptide deformylase [Ruminococcaceae bacterium]|nr:peptide deformylase [Oscillospiraceae bacterium]